MTHSAVKKRAIKNWQESLIDLNIQVPGQVSSNTLVFSIALNGYHWLYPEHIDSHQRYAKKHGYDHMLITKPFISKLGMECCWLKLTVLKAALIRGYHNVMFIDADAMINDRCPAIKNVFKADKCLYMAHGYTKRFNSGVIIAQQSTELITWLNSVIAARYNRLPLIDSTGWGENGHIIHLSKQVNFIEQLEHRWNNTFDTKLEDYIRHFSDGPLRSSWYKCTAHYVLRRTSSLYAKIAHKRQQKRPEQLSILDLETKKILDNYPLLQG